MRGRPGNGASAHAGRPGNEPSAHAGRHGNEPSAHVQCTVWLPVGCIPIIIGSDSGPLPGAVLAETETRYPMFSRSNPLKLTICTSSCSLALIVIVWVAKSSPVVTVRTCAL